MNLDGAHLVLSLLSLGVLLWLAYVAVTCLRGRTIKHRLAEIEALREGGTITDQEYDRARARILGEV